MNLKYLKTFQIVAEELNFSVAAIKLNYAQSTVSKHVQNLEESLGVTLLIRQEGKYELTLAGRKLYNHSLTILKELDAIEDLRAIKMPDVNLRLQGHDYYCFHYFLPGIRKMTSTYPNVHFIIDGSHNQATIKALAKNQIDLGIVSGNTIPSQFESAIIGYERVELCVNHKIYRPEMKTEDYIKHYPIAIDQAELYNTHNIFPYINHPLNIIDTNSDEVVEKAIMNHNMVGVVRTGRLQHHIEEGNIKVVETLIQRDPIHLIKSASTANEAAATALFEIMVEMHTHRSDKVVKWV